MELQKKKQQIDQMRDKHKELEVHVASLLDEAELKARLHGELETKYVLTDSEHDETPLVTRIAAAENTVRSQALALQHMQLALAEKKAEIDTERQKNEADGQCDHQREEMVETLILELNEALSAKALDTEQSQTRKGEHDGMVARLQDQAVCAADEASHLHRKHIAAHDLWLLQRKGFEDEKASLEVKHRKEAELGRAVENELHQELTGLHRKINHLNEELRHANEQHQDLSHANAHLLWASSITAQNLAEISSEWRMAQEALEHAVKQSLQETINKESVQETINKGVQEAIKTHTQAIDKRHTTKQQQGTLQEVDHHRALVQQQGTSSKVQLEATISRLNQESSRLTTQLHQLRATTAKSTTEAQELARRLKGEVQALKAQSIAEAARESKAREQAHRQEEELAEARQAVHLVSAEKAGLDARVGSKEVLLHELRAQVTRLTAELAEARSLKPASNVHSELQVKLEARRLWEVGHQDGTSLLFPASALEGNSTPEGIGSVGRVLVSDPSQSALHSSVAPRPTRRSDLKLQGDLTSGAGSTTKQLSMLAVSQATNANECLVSGALCLSWPSHALYAQCTHRHTATSRQSVFQTPEQLGSRILSSSPTLSPTSSPVLSTGEEPRTSCCNGVGCRLKGHVENGLRDLLRQLEHCMGEAGLDIQAAVHHVNIIGAEMEQIHIQRTVERKQNRERENARIEAMRKQAAALVLQEKNCAMQEEWKGVLKARAQRDMHKDKVHTHTQTVDIVTEIEQRIHVDGLTTERQHTSVLATRDAEMGELKQELMQQELMQQELIKQELIKQDLIHIPTPPHTNLDPGHHTYESTIPTDVIQAQELPLPHTTDEVHHTGQDQDDDDSGDEDEDASLELVLDLHRDSDHQPITTKALEHKTVFSIRSPSLALSRVDRESASSDAGRVSAHAFVSQLLKHPDNALDAQAVDMLVSAMAHIDMQRAPPHAPKLVVELEGEVQRLKGEMKRLTCSITTLHAEAGDETDELDGRVEGIESLSLQVSQLKALQTEKKKQYTQLEAAHECLLADTRTHKNVLARLSAAEASNDKRAQQQQQMRADKTTMRLRLSAAHDTIARMTVERSKKAQDANTDLPTKNAQHVNMSTKAQHVNSDLPIKDEVQASNAKSIAEAAGGLRACEQAHRQEEELAEARQAIHLVSNEKAELDARLREQEVSLHKLRSHFSDTKDELVRAVLFQLRELRLVSWQMEEFAQAAQFQSTTTENTRADSNHLFERLRHQRVKSRQDEAAAAEEAAEQAKSALSAAQAHAKHDALERRLQHEAQLNAVEAQLNAANSLHKTLQDQLDQARMQTLSSSRWMQVEQVDAHYMVPGADYIVLDDAHYMVHLDHITANLEMSEVALAFTLGQVKQQCVLRAALPSASKHLILSTSLYSEEGEEEEEEEITIQRLESFLDVAHLLE